MMTALCVVIAVETVLRKFFNYSLAGVDELSGYAIAVGAPLCFSIAAIEQSHIRINLIHMRLPKPAQATLNLLAALTLAALALYLAVFSTRTMLETRFFGSIAQTPWMTPLIWPQALWTIGMMTFAVSTTVLAVRAMILFVRKDTDGLSREFSPDSVEDELAAELSDLEERA